MAGIYLIRNMLTGCCYIGSTIDRSRRWRQHRYWLAKGMHHCTYLQRAWNKYGAEAFKFFWLLEATPEELLPIEQYFLDHTPQKYNTGKFAHASFRGRRHSAVSRQKMREGSLGRRPSEVTREKLRAANLGKKYSNETRRKVSEAMKGRAVSSETAKRLRGPGYWWDHRSNLWQIRIHRNKRELIHCFCDSEESAREVVSTVRDQADREQPIAVPRHLIVRVVASRRGTGKGYWWDARRRRFIAELRAVNGERIRLGTYRTENEAAAVVAEYREPHLAEAV